MEVKDIRDISYAEYSAAEGVNKSSLDWIAPPFTPAHFRARFITGELEDKETPAKRFGTILHRVILQPDTLANAFYVQPEELRIAIERLSKLKSAKRLPGEIDAEGKIPVEWNPGFKEAEDWAAAHADRPVLTRDAAKRIEACRDAVWRHSHARRLLAGGEMERSLFATDKDGLLRKGRLDCLCAGNIIPDLKSITNTDPDTVEKAIAEHRYYVQGPYLCDLCELLGIEKMIFRLIFVEKTPPYDVCVYPLDERAFAAGRLCYERDLAVLRECREKDLWPGRNAGLCEPIGLPSWQMKRLDEIL